MQGRVIANSKTTTSSVTATKIATATTTNSSGINPTTILTTTTTMIKLATIRTIKRQSTKHWIYKTLKQRSTEITEFTRCWQKQKKTIKNHRSFLPQISVSFHHTIMQTNALATKQWKNIKATNREEDVWQ